LFKGRENPLEITFTKRTQETSEFPASDFFGQSEAGNSDASGEKQE